MENITREFLSRKDCTGRKKRWLVLPLWNPWWTQIRILMWSSHIFWFTKIWSQDIKFLLIITLTYWADEKKIMYACVWLVMEQRKGFIPSYYICICPHQPITLGS